MAANLIAGFTLYGDPVSGNCLKPKYTADLLGIAYDWVTIDVVKGETRTPEFLALNPAGQVPVARWPDGRVLAQSNAIMLYIAEGSRLVPQDAFERAQVMSWLFWEQYSHETAIAVRRFHKHYLKKSDVDIDPGLIVRGNAVLGLMDRHLEGRDWFVGAQMTVADISLVAYTRVAHEGGFDLSLYPSVDKWVRRTELALGLPHARELA
jgi:glutathione S-transferase